MVGKVNSTHNDRLELCKRSSNYRRMVMSNASRQHRYQLREVPLISDLGQEETSKLSSFVCAMIWLKLGIL